MTQEDKGREGARVEWLINIGLAVMLATLMAAGYWIVMGHPAGGLLWCVWVILSLVTSTVIDLRRSLASGEG